MFFNFASAILTVSRVSGSLFRCCNCNSWRINKHILFYSILYLSIQSLCHLISFHCHHIANEGPATIKYSQKWNCYFQNRIIMFCLPVPTLIYLWDIYIFPGAVSLFYCRKIWGPILGIHMNVEIGTEAAQFPEREYINGISLQCICHLYPFGTLM